LGHKNNMAKKKRIKKKIANKKPEYYFDEKAADKVIMFFEKYLKHSKGEWANKPFILEQWQKKFLRELFGWKRKKDGLRRYREAYMEIPRKNGKSTLCAGIANYLTFADREPGAEVYGAAGDTGQASLVFTEAKNMVIKSPSLRERSKTYRRSIVKMVKGLPVGKYEVISSEVDTKHGYNASGVIFDELHTQPNRKLYDVLVTSTGSRRQPLFVMITTAGFDRNSICWEMHEYTRRVNDPKDPLEDETFLGIIYAADEKDDWTDPKVWEKCNPNLNVSLKLEYLKKECKKAMESPSYENTFRRLHLNQWTQQETRWLNMNSWDACKGKVNENELTGLSCWGGLDLASTTDLAALVWVFKVDGKVKILPRFWIPKANMIKKEQRDKVPYQVWVKQGLIEATPGNVIDYEYIRKKINKDAEKFKVQEIAYDPWNATQFVQQLQDEDGFTMVEIRQGFGSLSAPSKETERLVLQKLMEHGGNPILRWNADCVTIKSNPNGDIRPVKPDRDTGKRIDGIVAMIMGISRATMEQKKPESIYAKRGAIVF